MFKHSLLILYILLLLPIKGWSVDFTSDTSVIALQNTTTQGAVPQSTKILTKKSTNKPPLSTQTAGSVFIDFAKKVLGTSYEEKLGSEWENQIINYTKYWTAEDSYQFLSFLESRIGSRDTINAIKNASYLRFSNIKSFKERVDLYSQYIGEEAVNTRLKQSLGGYQSGKGKIRLIRSNIEFIMSYVNNEKEAINIMKNHIYTFSVARDDVHNLPNMLQLLETYISKKEVIVLLETASNFRALLKTPLSKLKDNISFLKKYLDEDQIAFMIKKNCQSVITNNFKEIKDNIIFLEYYLNNDQIAFTIKKSFYGVKTNSLKGIKDNIAFLTNYLDKSDIVLGLSNMSFPYSKKLTNLKESINFLEPYIGKEGITKKLKMNFIILSTDELKYLKQMEQKVGKTQTALYIETNILNSKPASVPSHSHASSKLFYNTAGFIFIEFAKKVLGTEYETTFGSEWEERIIYNTRYWTVTDSQNFLSFLENRIGSLATAKLIETTAYFKYFRFDSFKARVQLYTKYIGEEAVNARLKQSLYGFHIGKIDIIQSNIEFIRSYIKSDKIFNSILQKSIGWASIMRIEQLLEVIQFLDNYLNKEEIIWIMQRNINALSYAKINKLKQVVDFLENYVSRQKVTRIMKNSFKYFIDKNFNEIKDNIEFLESYIGKERVITLIEKHFYTLAKIKKHQFKDIVRSMEQAVGKEAVVESIMKDIKLSRKFLNQLILCKKAFQSP